MARRLLLASAAILCAAVLAGCDAPPTGALERARSAIEEARSAGAETWAGPEMEHAIALFESGRTEMSIQAGRFAMVRDYARAREILEAARVDAVGARDAAAREKDRAREEAAGAMRRARAVLDGGRASLRIAPSPRDGRAEVARLRSEIEAVEAELPAVEKLIETEGYVEAARRAEELSARVQKALSRFFQAIERRARSRGSGDEELAAAGDRAPRDAPGAVS